MRLKLCRNYNSSDHSDASAVRDNTASKNGNESNASAPLHVAQEAVVNTLNESIEEEDWAVPNNSASPPSRYESHT